MRPLCRIDRIPVGGTWRFRSCCHPNSNQIRLAWKISVRSILLVCQRQRRTPLCITLARTIFGGSIARSSLTILHGLFWLETILVVLRADNKETRKRLAASPTRSFFDTILKKTPRFTGYYVAHIKIFDVWCPDHFSGDQSFVFLRWIHAFLSFAIRQARLNAPLESNKETTGSVDFPLSCFFADS